jgi:CRISPR-associated endonuclease/helicase Cas3
MPTAVLSKEIDEGCLWSHSGNAAGQWHGLVEHLTSVASRAGEFAEAFGAAALAWWLGLLHDLGKGAETWQQRLVALGADSGRGGIDHKAAGTRFAVQRVGLWRLAMAIHGHHGGLENPAQLHAFLTSPERDRLAEDQAVRRLSGHIAELRLPTPPPWPRWALDDPEAGEMLLRMLFSALVDADHLDTATHFRGVERGPTNAPVGMAELLDRFERERARLLAEREPSSIDELRAQVYADSVQAAACSPGFFRLEAPTGAGKTLAAGGFALHHAERHDMRRVVFAVPFLSVTDQNAKVYRDLLDPDGTGGVVLEHHTAVNVDDDRRGGRWQRLAAENWDAEFIVTTTVQLFESIHARTPARMRKVHRLAGAVIVLDEVHAIPVHVLDPVLLALRQLVEHFGATVLFASATQPEFWHLPVLKGVTPTSIVADPSSLYAALRRVRYRWWKRPKPSLADVAAEAAKHRRALVVVNTTDHGRLVLREWTDARTGSAAIRHLSTRMCSRHRLDTIEDIRRLLAGDGDVLVVSTQLVEAGVDLDFPVVFRSYAPAEAVLQAAGRCNRDGHLGREGGLVVVFDPHEFGRPPSYELPLHETRRRFGPSPGQAEPDDLAALAAYFTGLYATLGPEARGQAVIDARREWDCLRVSELFKMISDESVPVLVDYTPIAGPDARAKADRVVAALQRGRPVRPDQLRHLQPFLASLPRSFAERQRDARLVRLAGDLHIWTGRYDPHFGIDLTPEDQ